MSESLSVDLPASANQVERLVTVKATAEALGVPYHQIQRAVRAGVFPTYRVFNGRRLLKLSEVVAVIERTREGGRP
jgi:predicted site-specific integrase-resolvase